MLARVAGLALAFASLVIWPRDAHAGPFEFDGADWEGCADFAQIARDDFGPARVIVTQRLEMKDLKREDALILLHPERVLDTENLSSFMRHGGRVVLLDDYGTGEALLTHFGIQRVQPPLRPAEMLRGNPSLAIAEPASSHPVVHDVGRVVTNHATGLRHPDLSPVLKIRAAAGEADVLVAEAGAVGQGRFLAVGDPSILINSMLRYPGNKAFARALLRYATDDDTWGKRNGRIFLLSGDFEQKGSFGEDTAFWDELNEWKRHIQDALESVRHDGFPAWLAYLIAGAVGLAVILWVGARAGKTHKPVPPRFVRKIPIVAQGGVAGHAAVIGAQQTSRVLAMLELKSALEEDLCGLLDLDAAPSHDVLLKKVAVRGLLDAEGLRVLRRLLLRMANVEMIVLARRGTALERIRDREVIQTATTVKNILQTAHTRARENDARENAGSPSAGGEALS